MDERSVRELLAPVRCFLLDMDGTFYLGDRLIDGSLDFLQKLKETGRTARFLTNNSSKSASVYTKKLEKMQVPEEYRDVISSAHAAVSYLKSTYPDQAGFLLGNDVLRAEMEAAGIRFTDQDPAWVLVAFDTSLDYKKMCMVCDFVRAGLPYIATHPDFNCPTETGFIPDAGAIMAFIEASTGRKADLILGKPYGGIVQEALARTGYSKEQLAICGDRLYTDIATGVNFGMTSILVLSGESTLQDLEKSAVKPTLVFDRLADMIPLL